MRAQAKNPADAALAADIGSFTHDPLGYVTYAFPWGTGELEQHHGPRRWQREKLQQIGEHLRTNRTDPIQLAVASGHGIGNSSPTGLIFSITEFHPLTPAFLLSCSGQSHFTATR